MTDAAVADAPSSFRPQAPGAPVSGCAGQGPSTGLGADVDALVAQSPTLASNLEKIDNAQWTVEYGAAGAGSYCDRNAKKIVVDANERGHPEQVVQTLAHESGHALYTPDPYVPPTGLTKQQYVDANVASSLKDEGEATLTNVQVRDEILAAGGPDIGVAGAQAEQYEAVAAKYPNPADRGQARQEIGDLFADGEHPSTSPTDTYRDYYAKPYADYYDQHVGGP